MTDVYGPFDAAPGDPRLWTQDQWYRHAPKWAPSGVNGAPASSTTTGDLPITFSGLNFTIGVGRGWVRGAGFERSGTPSSQAIAANTNASLSRRDRVVLRRDLAAKTVLPTLIQGTPSATPTAPAIQQVETGQFDEPLYSFLVPPNSGTTITGIVDERVFIDPDGGSLSAYQPALDSLAALGGQTAGKRIYNMTAGVPSEWNGTKYAALRSAPAALSFFTPWTNFGGSFSPLRVWREGRIGHAVGFIQPTAQITGDSVVAGVPADLIPGSGVIQSGTALVNGNSVCRCDVHTDGSIFLIPAGTIASGATVVINLAWPLD